MPHLPFPFRATLPTGAGTGQGREDRYAETEAGALRPVFPAGGAGDEIPQPVPALFVTPAEATFGDRG